MLGPSCAEVEDSTTQAASGEQERTPLLSFAIFPGLDAPDPVSEGDLPQLNISLLDLSGEQLFSVSFHSGPETWTLRELRKRCILKIGSLYEKLLGKHILIEDGSSQGGAGEPTFSACQNPPPQRSGRTRKTNSLDPFIDKGIGPGPSRFRGEPRYWLQDAMENWVFFQDRIEGVRFALKKAKDSSTHDKKDMLATLLERKYDLSRGIFLSLSTRMRGWTAAPGESGAAVYEHFPMVDLEISAFPRTKKSSSEEGGNTGTPAAEAGGAGSGDIIPSSATEEGIIPSSATEDHATIPSSATGEDHATIPSVTATEDRAPLVDVDHTPQEDGARRAKIPDENFSDEDSSINVDDHEGSSTLMEESFLSAEEGSTEDEEEEEEEGGNPMKIGTEDNLTPAGGRWRVKRPVPAEDDQGEGGGLGWWKRVDQ